MGAPESLTYRLPTGLFGRKRTLRLSPEFMEYENREFDATRFTRVSKSEMLDIKHSMAWIIWYRFYVGCDFRIDIRTKNHGVLKIRFVSYFSKNATYQKAYERITDYMWEHYFGDIVAPYKKAFAKGQEQQLCGVRLTASGAYFSPNSPLTVWPDVAVKEYEDYFALYNRQDPEQNKMIEFDEWESHILFSMLNLAEQNNGTDQTT